MTLDEASKLAIRRLMPLAELGEAASTAATALQAYAARCTALEELLKKNNIEIPK